MVAPESHPRAWSAPNLSRPAASTMALRRRQSSLRSHVLPGSCFVSGLDAIDDERIATVALVHGLRALGLRVAAMTPMVSDGVSQAGRWTSEHLDRLGREGSFDLPGPALSPYVLPPAPTPAQAAELAGLRIKGQAVVETYQILATWADVVVVEGVGGLAVRLGPSLAVHDLVRRLSLPLVLAIHPDPDSLRRAGFAKRVADSAGVRIAGWIATGMTIEASKSLPDLVAAMGAPALAELPTQATSGSAAAKHLDLTALQCALAVQASPSSKQGLA